MQAEQNGADGLTVRRVDYGAGWQWISRAWRLFAAQPLTWIATLVLYVLLLVAASLIPLGDLATSLLGPVFLGGLLMGAHRQTLGGRMELTDLISGFRERFVPLLLLGVIQLLAGIIIGVVAVVIVLVTIGPSVLNNPDSLMQISVMHWTLMGVALAVVIAGVTLAFWIAAPLVAIAGCKPWEAVERSFDAGLRNWRALLVFGLAVIGLTIAAVIPLGLGFIVLIPVLVIAGYTAFADLFWPDEPAPPDTPSAPSHPDANLPPPDGPGGHP